LDKLMLESLVEVIEEEEGIEVKKNIERRSLSAPRPKLRQGRLR